MQWSRTWLAERMTKDSFARVHIAILAQYAFFCGTDQQQKFLPCSKCLVEKGEMLPASEDAVGPPGVALLGLERYGSWSSGGPIQSSKKAEAK